jgi:hypothetical protein
MTAETDCGWSAYGQGNDGDTSAAGMQCAVARPIDMTKTAQYGPVFSQQRPAMERGDRAEGECDFG